MRPIGPPSPLFIPPGRDSREPAGLIQDAAEYSERAL
jgi:hypothetical protein